MEKNKFFVFCCAFIPGAGQMYLGMMKKGTAIMSVFVAVIFIAVLLSMGILSFFLPVIWFYSFFDTFNCAKYNADQRLQMDYRFGESIAKGKAFTFLSDRARRQFPKYLGIGCILIGLYYFYDAVIRPLYWHFDLPEWVYYSLNKIPSIIVAVLITWLGITLLKRNSAGKEPQEFIEYQEGKHE